MINGVMLATYGSFGGGAIGNLFAQWEAAGIFAYMLPFLLIYALVFGLLMKINLFTTGSGNDKKPMKGINAIIALAVALLALQFNVVSIFFAELFPRFGMGLAAVLIVLILGGLFIPTNTKNNWFMGALVVIVFGIIITVIYQAMKAAGYSFGSGGWFSYFWSQYWGVIVFVVLVAAVVGMSSSKGTGDQPKIQNKLQKLLDAD